MSSLAQSVTVCLRFRRVLSFAVLLFLVIGSCSKQDREVVLLATGDIMLGRHIGRVMSSRGADYPFHQIASTLLAADIAFGNLESIVSSGDPVPRYPDKPYNFHADTGAVQAIKSAGFDVLSLANNHAMDYGPVALQETRKLLQEKGIAAVGAGSDINEARLPAVVVRKGVRFGFLAYSIAHARSVYAGKGRAGVAPYRIGDIVADVQALRNKIDVLVVSLHWGFEYETMPTAEQRRDARRIVDAGADLIIGHHPHVMQGIELYQGKVIAYSLGNFIFDQKGEGTDRSFLVAFKFRDKALVSADLIPLDRFKTYYPRVAEGKVRADMMGEMKKISLPLNAGEPKLFKAGILTMTGEGPHQ